MGAIHEVGLEKGTPLWVRVALQDDQIKIDPSAEIVPGLIRKDHFSADIQINPSQNFDTALLDKGIVFHLRHGSLEVRQTSDEDQVTGPIGSRRYLPSPSRIIKLAVRGSIAFLF